MDDPSTDMVGFWSKSVPACQPKYVVGRNVDHRSCDVIVSGDDIQSVHNSKPHAALFCADEGLAAYRDR